MKRLTRRCFKAAAIACLAAFAALVVAPAFRSRAQSGGTYTITDLGTLSGGSESQAFGISNFGQVVGYSTIAGTASKRPFVTQTGTANLINLGTLGGDGEAKAINTSGQVVGYSTAASGQRAFIWRNGQLEDFLPPGAIGVASDINDSGRVVGVVDASGGNSIVDSAFVWDSATPGAPVQSLGTANGITPSRASGINNLGHIVGIDSTNHGFFFNGTTNVAITPSAGPQSFPQAISDGDFVVGATRADGISPFSAFIWSSGGGLKDLGTLAGDTRSFAYDLATVDGAIRVVGSSGLSPARAFIWQDADGDGQGVGDPTEMKELLTLVQNATGWSNLQEARAINGSGQIVGFGTKNGETHAFLLTPSDFPIVSVSVSPSSVTEDGTTNLVYTFTRVGSTTSPLTVNFTVSGTATFNTDYTQTGALTFGASSGTVTIGAGQTAATVTVDPASDSSVEPDETVVLTLTAGAYGIGVQSSATGTITNDDTIPSVSVSVAPSAAAAEDGATNLVYTFTRTVVTSNPLTVNFTTTGTADSNDFTISPSGSVTIPANQASATVTVDPMPDTTDEPNETVILTITPDAAYTIGAQNAATGTINDDDPTPTISINTVTLAEGNSSSTAFVFTVSLSNPSSSQVTVNYATAEGTTNPATGGTSCAAGTDFVNTSGMLTFAANETAKQVTVSVCGETDVEADETFFVNLSGNTNSVLPAGTKGTGTITNDDTNVIVTLSPLTVTESGTSNLVYTFTRTGVTTGALAVNYSVSGTALRVDDYSAPFSSSTGTVTISDGSSSATVTVDPTPDSILEGDETVALTVTSGTGYNIASPSSATGTITPDAPIVFTEEGNGIFAAAIDSVTFVRGPFRLVDDYNFSSDHLTRVILITSNLGMTQQDLSKGILSVRVAGYANPLPIENVGTLTIAAIPAFNVSYIVIKLPADLPNPMPGPNNLTLTVKMGSAESNATILSITP